MKRTFSIGIPNEDDIEVDILILHKWIKKVKKSTTYTNTTFLEIIDNNKKTIISINNQDLELYKINIRQLLINNILNNNEENQS